MKVDYKSHRETERVKKAVYKRPRKCAFEVDRKHMCPYCSKSYGNSSSRNLHVKLKHPESYFDSRSCSPASSTNTFVKQDHRDVFWSQKVQNVSSHSRSVVPHIDVSRGIGPRKASGGTGMRNVLMKSKRLQPDDAFPLSCLSIPLCCVTGFQNPFFDQDLHTSVNHSPSVGDHSSASYMWAPPSFEHSNQLTYEDEFSPGPMSQDLLDDLLRFGMTLGEEVDYDDAPTSFPTNFGFMDDFSNFPCRFNDCGFFDLVGSNLVHWDTGL